MRRIPMNRKRTIRPLRRVIIESLEIRTLLSAVLPDPIAQTLLQASPADGTLADGSSTPPASAFTPAQIRSAYGISSIKLDGVTGDGTGQTIAIVTADDDPDLVSTGNANFDKSDLHIFDQEYGLPDPTFTKIEQGSNAPDTGWSEEAALDVEWTHAIAPGAKIILIEAQSAGAVQLMNYGVQTAAEQSGVSVVTTSWGFGEFSGETSYDSVFTTPAGHNGVTFVASTGDGGAPADYPAYSPNVLAVGGTHLVLSGSNYSSETGYSSSGGGASDYEDKPSFQDNVTQSLTERTAPDVSFDGDPNTGVAVYDSYNGGYPGWYKIAGTSFSAPAWAGLIAIADQGRSIAKQSTLDGATQTLPKLYSLPSSDFHDVTSGNNGFAAGAGYDLVTGLGTPVANLLIPALAGVSSGTTNTASISGTVLNTATNSGISGVELYIDTDKSGVLASGDPTTTSSSSGTYSFTGLAAGTYEVREVVPGGYTLTSPGSDLLTVTLSSGGKATGENFDNAASAKKGGAISGTVYNDANGDGKLDTGDSGLSGVKLYLDLNKSGALTSSDPTATSTSTGSYSFSNIAAGTYELREVLPSGYSLTTPAAGYISVTVTSGGSLISENFGNAKLGSIAGTAFIDSNDNGKFDSGESGLAVTIYMDLEKNGVLETSDPRYPTSSNGVFKFNDIPMGTYEIREVVPSTYKLTTPATGYITVTLGAGGTVTGVNFGNAKLVASISGYAYIDSNSNGKLDTGEKVFSSVTIFIDSNSDGKLDDSEVSVATNASGYYDLTLITTGTFRIAEVLPSGYHLTNPKAGYYSVVIKAGTNVTNEDLET